MRGFWQKHRTRLLYLIVGFWNTVFGFGLFALCYHLFSARISYLWLTVICGEIAVINAFIGYKFLVFKGGGNWLAELLRFHCAYLISIGASTVMMWILVSKAHLHPITAQAMTSALVIVGNYFIHRLFTFSTPSRPQLRAV